MILCYTIKGRNCTMVLVRSFQIVSISQQSPDCLSQTVFVGLLGSLVQQNVWDQTRVSAVLYILTRHKINKIAVLSGPEITKIQNK